LDAMAAWNFVTQGAAFFAAWEDYKGGVMPLQRTTDPIGGYHETFYYKADTVAQIFYLQNSWGPLWGEGGLYQMPFAQVPILAKMGMDLHYAVFTAPSVPPPMLKSPYKYWQVPVAIPMAPAMPGAPVAPVAPVRTVTPVAPVAPVPPMEPIDREHVARVAPVVPVNPIGPIAPVEPVVPVVSAERIK